MSAQTTEPRTVFVRNINFKTDAKGLADSFSKFGEIATTRMPTTFFRGKRSSRGFGFIEFKTDEGYASALACKDPISVDGRDLIVLAAKPRQPRKRDTVFVRGIPEGTTDEMVKAAFAKYNPIAIRIKKTDGDGKGFAFVQFDTEEHQTAAVTENKTIALNGGESTVSFARPPQRRFGGRPGGARRGIRRAPREDRPRDDDKPKPEEKRPAPEGADAKKRKRNNKPRGPRAKKEEAPKAEANTA